MSKVPVGASIAHAYTFLFGRFFQILGTAWVPALLYGLGYFVFLTAMPVHKPIAAPDGAAMAVAAVLGVAFFLAIRSVLGISLTQEALGVRKDLTLAHFVIGPRELRLFFGYLRFYIVFVVLYAAVLTISFGAAFAAGKYGARLLPAMAFGGKPIAVWAALALTIVLAIWFALSMLRLVFLLAPVASAEHRTRISRAWVLTRGSSLRILIVYICTFLPAVIAFGVAFYYLVGPADLSALVQAFHNIKPGNPPPLAAFLSKHAPVLSLLTGIFAAINGALLAGASAAAYRTVTGHEDPELEDDAALVAPLLSPAEEPSHHEEPAADHGDHGHEDHGHGGHEDPGSHGHEDHGHGGHEEPAGEEEHGGHGHHDDHGHGDHGHDDHGHGGGHDDHGHGEDHGHGGHDDHGHDDHGHDNHGHGGHDDHGHGDGGHHAEHGSHAHEDHGRQSHGHDDHGHGHHAHKDGDRAAA